MLSYMYIHVCLLLVSYTLRLISGLSVHRPKIQLELSFTNLPVPRGGKTDSLKETLHVHVHVRIYVYTYAERIITFSH